MSTPTGNPNDHYFISSYRQDPDQVNNPGGVTSAVNYMIQTTPELNAGSFSQSIFSPIVPRPDGELIVRIDKFDANLLPFFNGQRDIVSMSRADVTKYVGNVNSSN